MRKASFVFCTSILCLYTVNFATINLNDGGYHLIDTEINDSIRIDFELPGAGTTVELTTGGSVLSLISACEDSQVIISGGSILYGELGAHDNSHATFLSGSLDYLCTNNYGVAEIYGGVISKQIRLGRSGGEYDYSIVKLYGSDFALDSNGLKYGQYFVNDFSGGRITGILANGDTLDCDLELHEGSSIILIPEPSTLLFLTLGVVMLRKK